MTTTHLIPTEIAERYEIHEWRNAAGILKSACAEQWSDIISVLDDFRPLLSEFAVPGGPKTLVTGRLDQAFYTRGWREKQFQTSIIVDEVPHETPTHKIDCVKDRVALEVEWSNKDPFFDRDLANFRILFDLLAIDLGVIITRTDEIKKLYRRVNKNYTATSTWMSKLIPKVEGGGAGGCPLLVFGIKPAAFVNDLS